MMKGWDVYLGGSCLTKVWYDEDCTAEEVRQGLVDHDGYNPDIAVEESTSRW